jgi:GNAT superfamily N-acetyltransferase
MLASDEIRRFAEEPDHDLPEPWLPGRRLKLPTFTIGLSPSLDLSYVWRVRTTTETLGATLAEVRGIVRDNGYRACAWFVGPSSRPADLGTLLAAQGFVPAPAPLFEPSLTAMALTVPPPAPPPDPGVEARIVRSFDEYVRAFRTGLEAYGQPESVIAAQLVGAQTGWEHESGVARMTHIAFADGQVAGMGCFSPGPPAILLAGAAVLPAFRGRGVYRALVASRWRAAVAMGKPALTVLASSMSRSILALCGFEEVCRVDVLLDPAIAKSS